MYIKIKDNIVVQRQPNKQKGFINVSTPVICGMVHDGSKEYGKSNFSSVAVKKTLQEIFEASMSETEHLSVIARKLEEVIEHIISGTPISDEAKQWSSKRKNMRKK